MAVSPLFIADMATLKSQLRLTEANESDALAIIDRAVQQARIDIYDAIESAQVSRILATGYVDNPTTTAQIERAKANQVELLMVKRTLLRELPTLFMDASAIQQEVWNEEGFSRRSDPNNVSEMIAALDIQIQDYLRDLEGDDEPDGGSISTYVSESRSTRPGSSVWR